MPQMAPISWLTLFLIFSLSFIVFNMLNYYCYNNSNKTINANNDLLDNSNTTNCLNWKW